MRALILTINFNNWICDNIYREQLGIKREIEKNGGECIFYGPGYDYETNDISRVVDKLVAENRYVDVIVCYTSGRKLLEKLPKQIINKFNIPNKLRRFPLGLEKIRNIPKVLWISDFWHMTQNEWERAIIGNGFQDALSVVAPFHIRDEDFKKYFSQKVTDFLNFHHFPRTADEYRFGPSKSKEYDVALLGALSWDLYPARTFFLETLKNQSWINFFHHEHPGYNYINNIGGITGDKYAEVLSKTKIFVTCGLKYNIPVMKTYEVLASEALLVCDHINNPELIGLIPNKNYIEVDFPDFMGVVKYYINNEDERKKIAKAGRELYVQRHTIESRSKNTYRILLKIIKNYVPSKQTTRSLSNISDKENLKLDKVKAANKNALIKRFMHKFRLKFFNKLDDNALFTNKLTTGSYLDWKNVIGFIHIDKMDLPDNNDDYEDKKSSLQFFNKKKGKLKINDEDSMIINKRHELLRYIYKKHETQIYGKICSTEDLRSIIWTISLKKGSLHKKIKTNSNKISSVIYSSAKNLMKDERFDLLYIENMYNHKCIVNIYEKLNEFICEKTVLLFDINKHALDTEKAISDIANHEEYKKLYVVSFSPSFYSIVIMANKEILQNLFNVGYFND